MCSVPEEFWFTNRVLLIAGVWALVSLIGIVSVGCCDQLCLSVAGALEMELVRKKFQSLKQYEQTQWIIDYLKTHSSRQGSKFTYRFQIGSKEVCQSAWLTAVGIKPSRFYNIRRAVQGRSKKFQIFISLPHVRLSNSSFSVDGVKHNLLFT